MQSARTTVLLTTRMTLLLVVFALTTIYTTRSTAADGLSDEPYPVFVTFDSAYVRCGPSQDYYRTDSLRQGQELEVYVETEDGWLGVRPPENSFCWVPASAVEAEKRGTIATVIEDRTVAWIGTHLGRAKRYRWQVQLAAGESVTVIGRSEREGPDGPEMWYRIVPPSGEFRWIHRDQVAMSAEELIAAIDRNRASQPVKRRVQLAQKEERNTQTGSRSRLADLGQSILSLAGSENTRDRSEQVPAPALEPKPAADFRVAEQTSGATESMRQYDERSGSSRRTAPNLRPVPGSNTVALQSAPTPANRQPTAQASVANSVPIANSTPSPTINPVLNPVRATAVGSGLNEQWNNNQVRQAVSDSPAPAENAAYQQQSIQNSTALQRAEPKLAKADFVSRPRLTDIGVSTDAAAPPTSQRATDSNWIIGAARQNVAGHQPGLAPNHQGAGVAQANTQAFQGNMSNGIGAQNVQLVAGQFAPIRQAVSPAAIDAVAMKTRGADVGQLQLILSRLMASRGSSAEAQPIADAANQISASATDELVSARARLLSERVQQYQRVAERRDASPAGAAMNSVQPASFRGAVMTTPQLQPDSMLGSTIPDALSNQIGNVNAGYAMAGNSNPAIVPSAGAPSVTGYLVQVYSARPNSPPYALTDHSGNTVSYVTPTPGTNIRHHINSYITVTGNTGYLPGLNTPHVLASSVFRAIE